MNIRIAAPALAMALALAAPALAQDMTTGSTTTTTTVDSTTTTTDTTGPTAPDGSRFFGFEPYFGILGGYDSFDNRAEFNSFTSGKSLEGAQIEGVLGANLPIGPIFVGVEGFGAKGFGPINWEYGVRGRGGLRIGESGLVYGSFGRTWIDMKDNRGFTNRDDWVYGLGVEVGPRDIGLGGLTGQSGARLRVSVESYDLKSIRPMAGVIFHF